MIDLQDGYKIDANWIVHPENAELQEEVDFARAQWTQADGDPAFFVADLMEGRVEGRPEGELVETVDEIVELSRLIESFDPLKHPRGKDGKFIHSGVSTSKWAKNSASNWAKKKIYYMSEMAAQGNWAAVKEAYTPPPAGAKGSAKYVWIAQQNLLKLQQSSLMPPVSAKPSEAAPGASVGWTKVGPQLGSNPGGTYKGPDGNQYYVKHSPTEDHARSEVLAAKLYEATGAGIVSAELVDTGNGSVSVATKWVDAGKVNWELPFIKKEAAENFAVHAWLGNWDAIGHPSDPNNILIDIASGKMISVDVGGSLKYRAQGALKEFGENVPEWDTLRNTKIAPMAGKVFGEMTPAQLVASAKKIEAVPNSLIKELCAKYHPNDEDLPNTLIARKNAILAKAKTLEEQHGLAKPPSPPPTQPIVTPVETVKVQLAAPVQTISTMEAAKAIVANHWSNTKGTPWSDSIWDKSTAVQKSSLLGSAIGEESWVGKTPGEKTAAIKAKAAELGFNTGAYSDSGLEVKKPAASVADLQDAMFKAQIEKIGGNIDEAMPTWKAYKEETKANTVAVLMGLESSVFKAMTPEQQAAKMSDWIEVTTNKTQTIKTLAATKDPRAGVKFLMNTPADQKYDTMVQLVKAGVSQDTVNIWNSVANTKNANLAKAKPKEMGGIFSQLVAEANKPGSVFATVTGATTQAPAVPPPPKFAGKYAGSSQAKVNKVYELASKGDIAGLEALEISAVSKDHYTKKTYAYKQSVLTTLGQGGKVSSSHVTPKEAEAPKPKPAEAPKPAEKPAPPKPTIETFKPDTKKFPAKPTIETSKADIKAANEKLLNDMEAAANAGDLPKLQAMKASLPPQSGKLNSYHDSLSKTLAQQIESHLNPPLPPVPFDRKLTESAKKISAVGYKNKVGYLSVHGSVGTIEPGTAIKENWKNSDHSTWHKENASKKTDQMWGFTGGWSHWADPMRANQEPEHVKVAKKQWNDTAVELPVGMTLSRKYSVNSSEMAEHLAGLKPGSVVSDKSFISTSTDKDVWSGNVQFRIQTSPGAKGVVAGSWSQHKSEQEIILGPSARMLIVKVESSPPASLVSGVQQVVHAVLLPPE